MDPLYEHRGTPRRPARLDAVIEYFPVRRADGGRWWENFPARMVNVSGSGVQISAMDRLTPGGRIRMIVPPLREGEATVDVEGDIVWVREPVLPWLGKYRAGIAFRPALQTGVAPLLERTETDKKAVAAR